MTTTNLPADRPIPDPDDLRLLAELINNVSIPLANAAWNARMSQAEAAARLVSMAERGMPLRLVADGDRNALWHIAQAGPAPTPVAPAPTPAAPAPHADAPSDASGPGAAALAAAPAPTTDAAPAAPRWAHYPVSGPAGENLVVTILDVLDPGDAALAAAGMPVVDGYRSVLVRSQVANVGQVPYPASADANLVLESDRHDLIGRAGQPPTSHAGFAIGIAPGQTVDGWSLFVIGQSVTLIGLKWCIRPDLPQTIIGWPIAP